MISICLFLTLLSEPVLEIQVDNKYRYLPHVDYNRVFLCEDNSFLAMSMYQVWHWDENGDLINVMGSRGEGPGEFMYVSSVVWNGEYYWIVDGKRLMSSVFDAQGNFIKRYPIYFRQLFNIEKDLYAVDFSQVDQEEGNFPQTLQKIDYQYLQDGTLDVKLGSLRFKKVSPLQKSFYYNFKLLWVVRDDNNFLVVDQLEPKVWIYSPDAIAKETAMGDKRSYMPKAMGLQVKHWVEPIPFPDRRENDHALRVWWRSWSRINYFGNAGEDYILAYEIPDSDDPLNAYQVVQRVDKRGKIVGEPRVLEGAIMGVRNNMAFLFREEDNEDGFSYFIHAYEF